jgi:uncharacterized protein (DUF3820 family)
MGNKMLDIIHEEFKRFVAESQEDGETGYYISSGSGGKKYTLRYKYFDDNGYPRDNHVATYGQDLEIAKELAKKQLGYVPNVKVSSVGKITKQLTYQHMPNGQYQGSLFSDVPTQYLSWWVDKYKDTPSYQKIIADILPYLEEKTREEIANYDTITFGKYSGTKMTAMPSDYLSWLMKNGSSPIIRGASELELQRRGEIVDGKTKTELDREELEKKRGEQKAGSQFVGNVSEKIELAVQVVNEVSFDSQWGTTYITRFLDENGNSIIYKGKQFIETPTKQEVITHAYEILNGNIIEIPNPYEGLAGNELKKSVGKNKMYEMGGEDNHDGTMRFHTWNGDYSEEGKQVLQMVKDLSNAGKLPKSDYVDKNGKFYDFDYSEKISNFQKGDWILLAATISGQNDYKGEKQTIIQRPKFIKKL